jgi:hypothetical protein
MKRNLVPFAWLCLLLSPFVAGCGGGSDLVAVQGQVNLDGQPVKEGVIRFAPADGQTTTQAVSIKDGNFEALLHRTTYIVRISYPSLPRAPAQVKTQGPDGEPTVGELIPPRYNTRSELKLEVKEARKDVRYDLKSK